MIIHAGGPLTISPTMYEIGTVHSLILTIVTRGCTYYLGRMLNPKLPTRTDRFHLLCSSREREITRKMIKLEWRRPIPDAFLRGPENPDPPATFVELSKPDDEHAQSSVHFRDK